MLSGKRLVTSRPWALLVVAPAGAFGAYRVFSPKLLAKEKRPGPAEEPSVGVRVAAAACHVWKNMIKILFADHAGLKDLRTVICLIGGAVLGAEFV